ncbi:MAG: response regulator [Thermodesulfobacteriota bacterium]
MEKEAIEIECPECGIKFRLWIPHNLLPDWETGQQVGCFKCRAGLKVVKEGAAFTVTSIKEEKRPEEPLQKAKKVKVEVNEKTLIIEDDKSTRKMEEEVLQGMETSSIIAKNSSEALDALQSNTVNLIIVDLHLKNPKDPYSTMNGEEFLWKVKEMGMNIPSIVTTGKDIVDDIIMDPKWFELNVKGFIQKGNPFWTEELKAKVQEILCKD